MKRFFFLSVFTLTTFKLFADIPVEEIKVELFDNIQEEPAPGTDTQKATIKDLVTKEVASKVTDVQTTSNGAEVPRTADKVSDVRVTENQSSTVAYLLYAIAVVAFAFLIWIYIRERKKD
jgi:hypothetical protein